MTGGIDFVRLVEADKAADLQQAEYFYRMLTEECSELASRRDDQRVVLAQCEQGGDFDGARRMKHVVSALDWDIRSLERLITKLHRRFGQFGS